MPWWSWILIWVALVSLSLLFFVLMGVRLFRQFMATVKELGEAGDKLTRLPVPAAASAGAMEAAPASVVDGVAPGTAPFASPHQLRHDYHASKEARREARHERRVRRKAERGQPQSLRDIEFR
ncbi:hypothetical protein [Arthrobacter globiformis]|uniref:hypothetical protein n=1 Tax=Arthrobacter globiformis TaxID=1665 RepID=UPI00277FF167|nr:hypothetical protein [Arthrobacter globiformis]MDQ0865389.1 hypothetical protein [Arthrobacter globiformis]